MRPTGLAVLNPAARGGRGRALWTRVIGEVESHADLHVIETDPDGAWTTRIRDAIDSGVRLFVAAGGDGTVSSLVNAIVENRGQRPLSDFTLGAVGLGSSNDFHKPFHKVIAGVPIMVDPSSPAWRDVGLARYSSANSAVVTRQFVVSAAFGVTANANAFFNTGDRFLRLLKRHSTTLAILYAAVHTIATHRNFSARLSVGGRVVDTKVTNLSIMKTPYLSGFFRYDTPVGADDGLLAVNLCEGLSRWGTLGVLCDLARGRFRGQSNRRAFSVSRLTVEADSLLALELDGEVSRASHVEFELLPERLRQCR